MKHQKKKKNSKEEIEHQERLDQKEADVLDADRAKPTTYELIVKTGAPATYIKILTGPLTGLVYYYGKVNFGDIPANDDEQLKVNFEYFVVKNPYNYAEDEQMVNNMGVLLLDLIRQDLNNREKLRKVEEYDRHDGIGDSTVTGSGDGLHEESDSIS